MPNHKVIFGPSKNMSNKTVIVLGHQTIEKAKMFVQQIVDTNEELPEERRVLGPLLSVEPTHEKAYDTDYLFNLGRMMYKAKNGC